MSEGPDPAAVEIFADALDLPEAARAEFLQRACAGDERLRQEVESLLATEPRAARAFERPLIAPPAPRTDILGTTVGPYRLTAWIAEGGMGAVYIGERIDREFEKKVAIKLIRPGAGSQEMLRRFRQERQVLASLEHPFIARLLDGGSTAAGDPYIVMEYIDGIAIDGYCDERRLSIPERLALFLDACDAVHFAHRHLVIHRDLKPSNILVDQSGQVKLLDFGIARVIEPTEDASIGGEAMTAFRALTPRYASPEQLRGAGVTTSSDVYSLGVILFELLTGRPPHDLRGLTPAQAERIVCESEAPIASRLVDELDSSDATRGGSLGNAAEARGLTTRKLRQRLSGDLDTILLRALARDPERRYQSAEELAADLRSHLTGLPVRARRDTPLYRLSRFARRNRALVAAACVIVVSLATALGVSLAAYRRATERTLAAEHLAYTSCLGGAEAAILLDRPSDATQRLREAPPAKRGWEWRHLAARIDRSLLTWRPHRKGVTQIAWLSGSDRFVSCSLDSSVALWKIDGTEQRRWAHQPSGVESICVPPGESEVIVGLSDGAVWRLPFDPNVKPIALGRGSSWAMVAASPSGRWIAAGFFDGTVKTWDRATGAPLAEWKAQKGLAIPRAAPSHDELLTAGSDGRLCFWDGRSFDLIRTVNAHAQRIYSLASSSSAGWIVTGSLDRTARVWDAAGAPIAGFHGHSGTVAAVAIEPSTRRIVSAGADGRVATWDGATGELHASLRGGRSDVCALATSPDDRLIATGAWGGEISLWRSETEDVRTLSSSIRGSLVPAIESADLDPAGTHIAYSTRDGNLVLLDLESGGSWTLTDTPKRARVRFSPEGSLLAIASASASVEVIDVASRAILAKLPPGIAESGAADGPLPPLFWMADGHELAIAFGQGVRFMEAETLEPIDESPATSSTSGATETRLTAIGISGDGLQFAIGGEDGSLRLFSRHGGMVATLGGHGRAVRGLAFAPDGSTLASVADDGGLAVWSLPSGRRRAFAQRPGSRSAVVFTRDGTRIITAGADQLVRIHEASSAKELVALHGHVARISALAFDAEDELLLSASADGTLRLWDSPREAALPSR